MPREAMTVDRTLMDAMPDHEGEIQPAAGGPAAGAEERARQERTRYEQKKAQQRQMEAARAQRKEMRAEARVGRYQDRETRHNDQDREKSANGRMTRLARLANKERRAEDLLEKQWEAIDRRAQKELKAVEMETGKADPTAKLRIEYEAQRDRAQRYREYSDKLSLESDRREEAKAETERQEIEANRLKKRLKLAEGVEDGSISAGEQARIERTDRKHKYYDFLSAVFKAKNPYSEEDTIYTRTEPPAGTYINKGRAFFGGTKPMYQFNDTAGKSWLYKEAVNCCGFSKPEGALMTEAASKLQAMISPGLEVKAFAARDAQGKVVGSFQEKLELHPDPPVDLFKWQDQAAEDRTPLSEPMKRDIMREHMVDWLLCNFDTKGENFLFDTNGRIRGIDKEQSFAHLDDPRARHMSKDYQPNNNDTLYNTIFKQFARGETDLNLDEMLQNAQAMQQTPDDEYMQTFEPMLRQKYGEGTPKYQAKYNAILARKNGLTDEYQNFFGGLIREREAYLREHDRATDAYAERLGEGGRFAPNQPVQHISLDDLAREHGPATGPAGQGGARLITAEDVSKLTPQERSAFDRAWEAGGQARAWEAAEALEQAQTQARIRTREQAQTAPQQEQDEAQTAPRRQRIGRDALDGRPPAADRRRADSVRAPGRPAPEPAEPRRGRSAGGRA